MRSSARLAILAVLSFLLAACGTTKPPEIVSLKTDYQAQLEAVKEELRSQRADRAAMIAGCSNILQTRATSDTQFALAAMATQSCYFVAGGISGQGQSVTVPAPPAPLVRPDYFDRTLAVADRVLGFGLQALGLKYVRDVGITQSNNSRDTTIAGYNTFGSMATAGFNANTQIAGLIQAPAPNNTYTLSGTGVLGSGTYAPVTRTCTSGALTTQPGPAGATNPLLSPNLSANC